jgi:hypothetical protein
MSTQVPLVILQMKKEIVSHKHNKATEKLTPLWLISDQKNWSEIRILPLDQNSKSNLLDKTILVGLLISLLVHLKLVAALNIEYQVP